MDGVVLSLQESSGKINTKFLEEALTKVQNKQETLSQLISEHEKVCYNDGKMTNILKSVKADNILGMVSKGEPALKRESLSLSLVYHFLLKRNKVN